MCDFKDCEMFEKLTCNRSEKDIFKKPSCYRPLKEKEAHSSVSSSAGLEGLIELAEGWEQCSKDRLAEYEKSDLHWYKGCSAAYSTCAEALRLLIAEAD